MVHRVSCACMVKVCNIVCYVISLYKCELTEHNACSMFNLYKVTPLPCLEGAFLECVKSAADAVQLRLPALTCGAK